MTLMLGLRVGLPRTAAEGTLPGGNAASAGVTSSKAEAEITQARKTASHTEVCQISLARAVIGTIQSPRFTAVSSTIVLTISRHGPRQRSALPSCTVSVVRGSAVFRQ